jgi:hypothetical protein
MDFSSLPSYPALHNPISAKRNQERGIGLSPRATRILRDLLVLVVGGMMLYELREMTAERRPAPHRAPLDFKLVQERIGKVLMLDSNKVEALLGPPSPQQSWEPEFQLYEAVVAAHPDRYPSGSFWWTKWTDPNDEGKWIAVFFVGGKAYHVEKKGF